MFGTVAKRAALTLHPRRTYYDNVTFCFCSFDQRCNGASGLKGGLLVGGALLLLAVAGGVV